MLKRPLYDALQLILHQQEHGPRSESTVYNISTYTRIHSVVIDGQQNLQTFLMIRSTRDKRLLRLAYMRETCAASRI